VFVERVGVRGAIAAPHEGNEVLGAAGVGPAFIGVADGIQTDPPGVFCLHGAYPVGILRAGASFGVVDGRDNAIVEGLIARGRECEKAQQEKSFHGQTKGSA
jgi:hypothetical protein